MVAFSEEEKKKAGDIQLRSRTIEQLLKKIVAHDEPLKELINEAKPCITYDTYKNLHYFRKNRNIQGHESSLSNSKYKKLVSISDNIIDELEKIIQSRTNARIKSNTNNVDKQSDNNNNIFDIRNTVYNADNCKETIIDLVSKITKFLDDKGANGSDLLEKFESLKDIFHKENYHNFLTKINRINYIHKLANNKEDIRKELFDCFISEYKLVCQEFEKNSSEISISASQYKRIIDARKELLESLEKIGGKGVLLVDKLESLKKILPQDKYKVLERQVNYVDNIWGVIVNSLYVSQENYDDFWENFEYAKKEINSISNEIKANDDGWKGCLFFIVIFIIYLFPVTIPWLLWLFIINIPVIISKNGGDSGCVTTIFFFYALVGIANPLSGVIMIIVYIIEGVVLGIFNSSNDQKNKELK